MRRVIVAATWVLAACGPPSAPPPAPVPRVVAAPVSRPPPTVEADPFTGQPVQSRPTRIRSKRYQLSFPVPDRDGWKLGGEGKSRFVTLTHGATGSVIVFARWRAPELMNRQRCAAQAHLWRELPGAASDLDEAELIERPRGYDTGVAVGFSRGRRDGASGYAAAFGALGRSCLAVVFRTEARGPEAERLVGERLAVIRTAVLPRLRLHDDRDIDPRR